MRRVSIGSLLCSLGVVGVLGVGLSWGAGAQSSNPPAADTASSKAATPNSTTSSAKPALTVKWVQPAMQPMTSLLAANGSVAPWAEAVVSAEVGGYRLSQVLAQVGDRVKKGQVLAKFSTESARLELASATASALEAEASAMDASSNAQRARAIEREGFYSAAQLSAIFSAEKAANARWQAAKARQAGAERTLKETDVVAPDDGVVSSRAAVLGAVVPQGGELFRLIRQGRLEWRVELTSAEISQVKPGMAVFFTAPASNNSATSLQAKVSRVSPTVDPVTRTAMAFVDVPAALAERLGIRSGSFVKGEIEVKGAVQRQSVPQSAVVLRDGFSYVFALGAVNPQGLAKVAQLKVQTGTKAKIAGVDWITVTDGLKTDTKIVAQGAAFLADGDTVKVSQP
jgi:HlyD family secretion protein